jgi:cytochrome c553
MKREFLLFSVLISCGPNTGEHKPLNLEFRVTGAIDFSTVKPVFAKYCASCHPSRSAPNWLEYSLALPYVSNGLLRQRVVIERSMPPPGSPQAESLTDRERNLIAQWINAGAPLTSPRQRLESADRSDSDMVAESCVSCHGTAGPQTSSNNYIPKLGGQNLKYLERQLHDYKWFERIDPSNEMNQIAASLDEKMISKVSEYFANSNSMAKLGRDGTDTYLQEPYQTGSRIADNACNSCHMNRQLNGRPSSEFVPALRGQSEQYLINQLLYFKRGLRKNPLMETIAKRLTREEIKAISVYYASESQ